jgi:uncharacterized membrane protein YcaP (DUF421 family)
MDPPMLFDSWESLLRVVAVGGAAYIVLVIMLRLSVKRTLSKMNAFDLVVTVALGSTLATVLLDRSVPLADGLLALALLVFCQYAITWASVRSYRFQQLVKAAPTELVRDGLFLQENLRAQRVTREEIEAALRQHGVGALADARRVTLETDGSLSVVARSAAD